MTTAVTVGAARTAPLRSAVARGPVLPVLLGLLGLAARLWVVASGGGLHGVGNYDDAVYFSAADALVHGRLPYRDFLFLQPPGILLVLSPFAALGSLVGDANAWSIARLAFLLLGGLNTALTARTLRPFGRTAQLAGGLAYALGIPAIFSERTTILEPIGTTAILLTLAVLARPGRTSSLLDPGLIGCGAVFGLAVTTKLWYVLPAVLLLPLLRRGAASFAGGAAAAAALVVGPFLLADPVATVHEIVVDQLDRPRIAGSLLHRFRAVVQPPSIPGVPPDASIVVVALVVAGLAIVALTVRGARRFVIQLAASLAVLAASPSYYRHYAALAVPFVVLVVGAAAGRLGGLARQPRNRRMVQAALVVTVLGYTAGGWHGAGWREFIRPPLPAAYVTAVHHLQGCVTSDNPTWLILTDRLTRDLAEGCAVWPDTTGWRYDRDAESTPSGPAPLYANRTWQTHLLHFLATGRHTLLNTPADEFAPAELARLRETGAYADGFSIDFVPATG